MWICLCYFYNQWLFNVCWLKINIEWKTSALHIGWPQWIYVAGIPCFTVLRFIVLHRYCVFYKLKVCGNLALSKSIGTSFPTAFAHFLYLSHFRSSCSISNFFFIIIFVLVICDQCSFFNWSIVDLQYYISFRCTT